MQWGTEEIQFMPEPWRFEGEKGGWEPQKTVVRKGSEELPPPLSRYCALGFPSSIFSLKPLEFRHKLNFFSPLLPVAYTCDGQLSKECTYMLDAYICIGAKVQGPCFLA